MVFHISYVLFSIYILAQLTKPWWKENHVEAKPAEDKKSVEPENNQVSSQTTPTPDVVGIIELALSQMNCNPMKNREGKYTDLRFNYQSQNFLIRIDENYRGVRVFYPVWFRVELSDVDMAAETKAAVNKVNKQVDGPALFYDVDKEKKVLLVSSVDRFVVFGNWEQTRTKIEVVLNSLFDARNKFYVELASRGIKF